MPKISYPIPQADLDFYEGHFISLIARAMAEASEQTWNDMSCALRSRWRDKALPVAYEILADKSFVSRLPLLGRCLRSRI